MIVMIRKSNRSSFRIIEAEIEWSLGHIGFIACPWLSDAELHVLPFQANKPKQH